MSENSHPGGQKRKRPDDEDEDEDPLASPSRRFHFDIRQQVLDLTYAKLERLRHYPDSRLSRYVLILNTFRSLEQDMIRDGIKIGAPASAPSGASNHQVPFDPSRPPPPDDAKIKLEDAISSVTYSSNLYAMETESRTATPSVINSSDAPNVFPGTSSGASYASEYDRYLMDLDSSSSGRATPFVRSDVETGALWNEDSDRLTSLNWSSVLKMVDGGSPITTSSQYSLEAALELPSAPSFDASSSSSSSGCSSDCSMSDDAMSCSETSLHTLMPVTTGNPTCINSVSLSSASSSSSSPKVTSAPGNSSSESGSSPSNSEDEIFGDIDLALYDYDFTLSPPNVKMAPVSAEELMRSLSNDQKSDNLVSTNNYFKKDPCSDDREQFSNFQT